MADGDGSRSDFNRAIRLLAAAETIDPILAMPAVTVAGGFVQVHFVIGNGLLDKGVRFAFELAAVHIDFALRAEEGDPAAAAVDQFGAVVIQELHSMAGLEVLGRDDFDRSRLVHTQSPLRDVEMVRTPSPSSRPRHTRRNSATTGNDCGHRAG